jgi:CheY-like chemotaxis protein
MMPEMDGIQTAQIIRNEIGTEYAQKVPLIALTANALVGNEAMFLENGFSGYISKPIDIGKLDVELNKWVRNKQNKETLLKAREQMLRNLSAQAAATDKEKYLDFGGDVGGVDILRGIQRYGGEKGYLAIVNSYVKHTPKLLEKMRNLAPDNLKEYAIAVHGLKGSSYGINASEVADGAEALEQAAKSNDFLKVSENNAAFIQKAEKLLADLAKLLEESADANKGNVQRAKEPDKRLLLKIMDACKRFRPMAMDEALAELEKYEYEIGGELIVWLRQQTDALEYDKIFDRLQSLSLEETAGGGKEGNL